MTDTPTEITVHRQLILDERLPNDGSYPLAAEYTITREEAIAFVREALRLHSMAPAGPVAVMFDCVQPVIWRGDFEEMNAGDVEDVAALPEYDGISLWDGTLSLDRHGLFLKATDHGREVAHVGLTSIEDLIQSFDIQYNEERPRLYLMQCELRKIDDPATVARSTVPCRTPEVARLHALQEVNAYRANIGLADVLDPDKYEEALQEARDFLTENQEKLFLPADGDLSICIQEVPLEDAAPPALAEKMANAQTRRRARPR